jgi:hypothetical protein
MDQEKNLIRTMVRSIYDLQKIRVQLGNRVTGNFKHKLGLTTGSMSEHQLAAVEKKILDELRESYDRITDGVVNTSYEDALEGTSTIKLPNGKKFKSDGLIDTYTELVLVNQYVTLLKDEEVQFKQLGNVLKDIPIYKHFLVNVKGVGPAIAGIIISEIDIHKAEYPSSLWAYSGLDAVPVGRYIDDDGKEHFIPSHEIDFFYRDKDRKTPMFIKDKYPVTFLEVGRSRKDHCLVDREYIKKDGVKSIRKSITYNPFLKTKLIGVLGTSFLRGRVTLVDGARMSTAKRLELASSKGFVSGDVETFLRSTGHEVIIENSQFAQEYYNYKNRLNNHPVHKDKTELHKHNMAIRFMIKRFLVVLYREWRKLEKLPIASEYSEGKLGMIHKTAT